MQSDEERLNIYRAALANLCMQNGGSVVVKTMPRTPPGTLMNRWVEDGIEFRFVSDEQGLVQ